jgi:predicted nucleic acid-binding protein
MSDARGSADLQQPDVGAILEELRAAVRAQRLAQGRAEPSSAERELQRTLDEIELSRVVSAHWPLLGASIPQRAVALVNKLVRRYLRWYINPIVEQQNAYNDAVARTLRLLAESYAGLGEQIDERPTTNDQRPTTNDDKEARRQGDKEGGQSPISRRTTNDERRTTAEDKETRRHGDKESGQSPISNLQSLDSLETQHSTLNTQHFSELMSLVRERAGAEPPARFPDLELRAMEPQLRLREQVSAHWPLLGASIPQRAVALVNKLVRRYLRWYINPIVEQQNAANAAFTAALLRLIALDAERRAQAASMRAHQRRP